MGRVCTKTKTVKKSSRQVIERYYSRMTLDFHTNKKILEEVALIPSKRLRNKIAGFSTHLMKRIQKGPVRGISLKLQGKKQGHSISCLRSPSRCCHFYRHSHSVTSSLSLFLVAHTRRFMATAAEPMSPLNTRVGWIGTGVMGQLMCAHLIRAGYKLTVFNRTVSRAQPLLDMGAQLAPSPLVVASQSNVVFSIVGYPSDVRSVLLGPNSGALSGLRSGGVLINMTTSKPSSRRLQLITMETKQPPSSSQPRKIKAKRKRTQKDPELERLNSLPWNSSLPEDDDPFSMLVGSNELEGGFLSLEEIDDAEYGLEIPEPEEGKRKKSKQNKNLKKQKQAEVDSTCGDVAEVQFKEKNK